MYMKMGSWFSKSETVKATENLGNENINNVVIQEPVQFAHADIFICIYILTIIAVVNFVMKMFSMYKKYLKKKYVAPI